MTRRWWHVLLPFALIAAGGPDFPPRPFFERPTCLPPLLCPVFSERHAVLLKLLEMLRDTTNPDLAVLIMEQLKELPAGFFEIKAPRQVERLQQ